MCETKSAIDYLSTRYQTNLVTEHISDDDTYKNVEVN